MTLIESNPKCFLGKPCGRCDYCQPSKRATAMPSLQPLDRQKK